MLFYATQVKLVGKVSLKTQESMDETYRISPSPMAFIQEAAKPHMRPERKPQTYRLVSTNQTITGG
jgi:hypothetical protein